MRGKIKTKIYTLHIFFDLNFETCIIKRFAKNYENSNNENRKPIFFFQSSYADFNSSGVPTGALGTLITWCLRLRTSC